MAAGQTMQGTPRYGVTILTSDPTTGIIEAKFKGGETRRITVFETAVAFRWPVAGESWVVRQENGTWYLDSPIPSPTQGNPINTVNPGDTIINSPTGVLHVQGSASGSTDFTMSKGATVSAQGSPRSFVPVADGSGGYAWGPQDIDLLQNGVVGPADLAVYAPTINPNTGAVSVGLLPGTAWVKNASGLLVRTVVSSPNLISNPLTTYPAGGTVPNWRTNSPNYWLNSGATCSMVAQSGLPSGSTCCQIVSTANVFEGILFPFEGIQGAFQAGVPYTFSVWLKGSVGGEQVQLALGQASSDSVVASFTLTTSWQRYSVTWTPTQTENGAYAVIRGPGLALAQTYFANAAQVTQGSAPQPYAEPVTVTPNLLPPLSWTYAVTIQMDATGRISAVTLVAASSAGSVALTTFSYTTWGSSGNNVLVLANVGIYNNGGTYQLSATTTPTQGTNWIDRRPWARGAYVLARYTGGNITIGGTFGQISQFAERVECTGAPVRLAFRALFSQGTAAATLQLMFYMDGAVYEGAGGTIDYNQTVVASAYQWVEYIVEFTPSAGSHLFTLYGVDPNGTNGGVIWGNTNQAAMFSVEEVVRQNANNGTS